MQRTILFKFYSAGWGGHELMTVNNIHTLIRLNVHVYISCLNPAVQNKIVEEFPELAVCFIEFDTDMMFADGVTTVIVVNSILHLARHYVDGNLAWSQINKSYFYAPFWGFEWSKGAAKLIRKAACHVIGFLFRKRIIGISSFFFERVGLVAGIIWPNTISRKYNILDCSKCNKITLVNIGRIDFEHKQQDKLIDWFVKFSSELPFMIEKLLIIGSGVDEIKLKEKSFESKLISVTDWTNNIIIPSMSILVICSRFEGLPLVALEAMASNIPIIYHNECGLDNLLEARCVFDVDNSESMWKAILYVKENWDDIVKSNFSTYSRFHSVEANEEAIKFWSQKL